MQLRPYDKFDEHGTAHAVARYLRRDRIRLGIRPHDGPNRGNIEWRPALVSNVYRILARPACARTYAYGRTPIEPKRRRRSGQPGSRHAPMAEWAVTMHNMPEGSDVPSVATGRPSLRTSPWDMSIATRERQSPAEAFRSTPTMFVRVRRWCDGSLGAVRSRKAFVAPVNMRRRPKRGVLHLFHV
jgi:hypothetical protein